MEIWKTEKWPNGFGMDSHGGKKTPEYLRGQLEGIRFVFNNFSIPHEESVEEICRKVYMLKKDLKVALEDGLEIYMGSINEQQSTLSKNI